jgi:hypothetical protein
VLHSHHFSGNTSYDVGHSHEVSGRTRLARDTAHHVHSYYSTTSYNEGHIHHVKGVTGPAIYRGKGHYHNLSGVTTVNGRTPHSHRYRASG